jgi:hypothetical protein
VFILVFTTFIFTGFDVISVRFFFLFQAGRHPAENEIHCCVVNMFGFPSGEDGTVLIVFLETLPL